MTEQEKSEAEIYKAHLRRISIEFTRVMGGGSECFTQVGDEHFLCPHYLRTRFADRIETMRRNKRKFFTRKSGK